MLEELTDKHLTLFGWFPMLRFLQRTCTYMQYECIKVNHIQLLPTFTCGEKKCITENQPRWTKLQLGRTNYNLNFTGVGQNVRWFSPYVGQFREWVGQTITSISLPCRTKCSVVSSLRWTISWIGQTNYYLNFTGVGQNVRLFPPHVGQFREWVGQWPCPTDILRYSIQSIIRKNRGV